MNVLFVGLNDNGLSVLFKLLLKEWGEGDIFVESVGTSEHADKEFSPSESVVKIALRLGYIITPYNPPNQKLLEYAKKEDLSLIHHQPRPISEIADIDRFGMIATPYLSVFNKLLQRNDLDATRVKLICGPSGIDPATSPADAYPLIKKWVETNF